MVHYFLMNHSLCHFDTINKMKAILCSFILSFNHVDSVQVNVNCLLVGNDLCSIGTANCFQSKLTLKLVEHVPQASQLPMSDIDKNHDKGLPQTPVVVDTTEKIPILTNNFTGAVPVNPILWGPNQPWFNINTYQKPTNWRTKELLSIPRVTRMVLALSDPCSHTSGTPPSIIGGGGSSSASGAVNLLKTPGQTVNLQRHPSFESWINAGMPWAGGFWRVMEAYILGTGGTLTFVGPVLSGSIDGSGTLVGLPPPIIIGGDSIEQVSLDGITLTTPGSGYDQVIIAYAVEVSSDGVMWPPWTP